MLLGLAAGLGAAVVGTKLLDGDDSGSDPMGADRRVLGEEVTSPGDVLEDGPVPPGAGAASAESAITSFLDAEVAGDYERSFGYLSDADRQLFGSPAGWVAAHASTLAPILRYDLGELEVAEQSATVPSVVDFEAALDPVVGLVPGRADVTWQVLRSGDGAWGVSLDESAVVPHYPPDSGAADAARTWLDARRACEAPDNERSGLVGVPSLADRLCDAPAPTSISEVGPLRDVDATPVATAFGPEAVSAARIVRLGGPVELGVVLVPIGDRWTVIGVLP